MVFSLHNKLQITYHIFSDVIRVRVLLLFIIILVNVQMYRHGYIYLHYEAIHPLEILYNTSNSKFMVNDS